MRRGLISVRAGFLMLTLVLVVGMGAAAAGCFHPDKPACAFSCADPLHTCPAGFTCGGDGLCHDPTSAGLCEIQVVDASSDGGETSD